MNQNGDGVPAYRIVRWGELYEITASREFTKKQFDEPLRYVKLRVHGRNIGDGYADLHDAAGDEMFMATFGLFCKCLEIAGQQPRANRDGTLYARSGRPASDADLARFSLAPLAMVAAGMEQLVQCRWIERYHWRPSEVAAASEVRRNCDATASEVRREFVAQRNETETELYLTKPNEEERDGVATELRRNCDAVPSVSGIAPLEDSASVSGESCSLAEKISFHLGRGISRTQDTANATTLVRACSHYLMQCHDRQERKRLMDQLLALAREKGKSSLGNKWAGFVAACKEKFGEWPELEGQRIGS